VLIDKTQERPFMNALYSRLEAASISFSMIAETFLEITDATLKI